MEVAGLLPYDPEAQRAALARVMDRIHVQRAEKRASATSPDESVSVTVDGNGEVVSIDLVRGAVRQLPTTALGAAIRDTVNAARAEAARRSRRLVAKAFAEDRDLTVVFIAEEDE